MISLIGVHECKLDAKGRLLLPSDLKKQLLPVWGEGFVIKRSVFHQCLEIHPMTEWKKVMERMNKLNRFVKKNNDFIRLFTAGVRIVEPDASGRLLVPKDLMNFAELEKEVVLSSSINMVEVWGKDKYETVLNDPDLDFAALAEEVMGGPTPGDDE